MNCKCGKPLIKVTPESDKLLCNTSGCTVAYFNETYNEFVEIKPLDPPPTIKRSDL